VLSSQRPRSLKSSVEDKWQLNPWDKSVHEPPSDTGFEQREIHKAQQRLSILAIGKAKLGRVNPPPGNKDSHVLKEN
jgi:hypothetical protein